MSKKCLNVSTWSLLYFLKCRPEIGRHFSKTSLHQKMSQGRYVLKKMSEIYKSLLIPQRLHVGHIICRHCTIVDTFELWALEGQGHSPEYLWGDLILAKGGLASF